MYFLDTPFDLSTNITKARNEYGISFDAMCKSDIDLEIAKLKGHKPTDKERALGPLLSIGRASGGKVIKVEAGISFFGADPVNLSLDYTFTKKYFDGKMKM